MILQKGRYDYQIDNRNTEGNLIKGELGKMIEAIEGFIFQNPYQLRKKAIEGVLGTDEKGKNFNFSSGRQEFGRIIYQFGVRRGYQDIGELMISEEQEQEKIITHRGIQSLESDINEFGDDKEIKKPELGQFFASVDPHEYKIIGSAKTLGRATERDMYRREFSAIWKKQAEILKLNDIKIIVEEKNKCIGKSNRNTLQKKYLDKTKSDSISFNVINSTLPN